QGARKTGEVAMQEISDEFLSGLRSYCHEKSTNRKRRCYDRSHRDTKCPNIEFHKAPRCEGASGWALHNPETQRFSTVSFSFPPSSAPTFASSSPTYRPSFSTCSPSLPATSCHSPSSVPCRPSSPTFHSFLSPFLSCLRSSSSPCLSSCPPSVSASRSYAPAY